MRPRGQTPRMRTARKLLCPNGLPWQLRAVGRWCGMMAEVAPKSVEFCGRNYPVFKDLRPMRALPGSTAAPKRSIHGGEDGRHTITGSRRTG